MHRSPLGALRQVRNEKQWVEALRRGASACIRQAWATTGMTAWPHSRERADWLLAPLLLLRRNVANSERRHSMLVLTFERVTFRIGMHREECFMPSSRIPRLGRSHEHQCV
jgi:hypothetical protein